MNVRDRDVVGRRYMHSSLIMMVLHGSTEAGACSIAFKQLRYGKRKSQVRARSKYVTVIVGDHKGRGLVYKYITENLLYTRTRTKKW